MKVSRKVFRDNDLYTCNETLLMYFLLFCFVCSVHDTSVDRHVAPVFLSNLNCHFECVTYFLQVPSALKHALLQIAFLV